MSELMKPAEVADEYRTTVQTLANWRWAGRGPRFVKLGGKVLYRRSDLESWLNEHATDPEGSA